MIIRLQDYFDINECHVEAADIEAAENPTEFVFELIKKNITKSNKNIYTSVEISSEETVATLVKCYFSWLSKSDNESSFTTFLFEEAERDDKLRELVDLVDSAVNDDIDYLVTDIVREDGISEFLDDLNIIGLDCAGEIDSDDLRCSISEYLHQEVEYDFFDCINLSRCLVEVICTPYDIYNHEMPTKFDLYNQDTDLERVQQLMELLSITPSELMASGLSANSQVNDDVLMALLDRTMQFESSVARVSPEDFFQICDDFSNNYQVPGFFFYVEAKTLLSNLNRRELVIDANKAYVITYNGSSGSGDLYPLKAGHPIHIDQNQLKMYFPEIDLRHSVDSVFGLVKREFEVSPVSTGKLHNIPTEILVNDLSSADRVTESENYEKYKKAGLVRERLLQKDGKLSIEVTITSNANQIISERNKNAPPEIGLSK